jgi:hypothetical protein
VQSADEVAGEHTSHSLGPAQTGRVRTPWPADFVQLVDLVTMTLGVRVVHVCWSTNKTLTSDVRASGSIARLRGGHEPQPSVRFCIDIDVEFAFDQCSA